MINTLKFTCSSTLELANMAIGGRNKCESNKRMDDMVVVITGANTGIGKVTAIELSLRGAKVVMGCRNREKGEEAGNEILLINPTADLLLLRLDLSSLKSIRDFAKNVSEKISTVDILINNAGVMMCPEWQTEDGFEMQFGTNHLGHFLLTHLLLPLLRKSKSARIVTVSSSAYMMGKIHLDNINLRNGAYSPTKAYAQSKLSNILFTRELGRRLGPNCNIRCYCLHPGVIQTDLQRHMSSIYRKLIHKMTLRPELGAQTTLYCVMEENLDNETGFYYANCKRIDDMASNAVDDNTSEKLWELSADMVSLEDSLRLPHVKTNVWQTNTK